MLVYKPSLRLFASLILILGACAICLFYHRLHGWVSDISLPFAGAAIIYASLLLVEEGRQRERADRQTPKDEGRRRGA